jgi:outer membrane protein assembly factor BamB
MGVEGPTDPSVTVFRSDTRTSWTSFRLGSGLNVVVVDPSLPREFAWRFNTGSDGISASPVVYRNLVLVDSNDHRLYAADAATGHVLWTYRAESALMSQPVYKNSVVVIATGTGDCSVYYPPYYVAMDASIDRLEGLNLETGSEVWSTGLAGTGMPTPAIVGDTVIHVDGNGSVLAVDERTGAYRWHAVTPSIFSMTGVVDGQDGRIYAPGSFPDDVYAWNVRNGSLVWKHVFSPFYGGVSDGPLASTPSMLVGMYLQPLGPGAQGWVVQYLTPSREHIYALDKRTGQLLWNRVVPNSRGIAPTRNEASIPLLYRGRVYIGSSEASVVTALDLQTGHVAWQVRTEGPVKGGMVGLDGVVYFGDLGGYLFAVNAQSGRVIGRKRENVHFNVGSPIAVNESLIDGSLEGPVIAVPLRWIRDAHD